MDENDLVVETVLLAGKIMIESGADMTRVDDTLKRIAANAGAEDAKIFETTTGIVMSIPHKKRAQVETIEKRTINLGKVAQVNDLSRAFQAKTISLVEMKEELLKLCDAPAFFAMWWQILAAVIVSSTLAVMYGACWQDFVPTMLASAVGYFLFYFINKNFKFRFVSEFVAAVVIGLTSIWMVKLGFGVNAGLIIVGALMPLVPGVPITNSVRDLLAGHILSGLARGTEALLVAGALGLGIAVVFRFM